MDFFVRLYFATSGRIGRQDFWTGFLGVLLVVVLVFVIVDQSIGANQTGQLVVFVAELVLAYPMYAVMAKRFQDRGRPGFVAAILLAIVLVILLLSLLPLGLRGTDDQGTMLGEILGYIIDVIGIYIIIDLGIMRGTPGPNAYGPDPIGQ